VAIGLGLAVVYEVAFMRYQLFMSRHSPTLATALTAVGFLVRLSVFAIILILLAVFTELNIVAVAVAFVVLYTILSAVGMHRYLAKAKRDKAARGTGSEGGVVGG
jgi:membrane protein implicated in regulation of membrane protease activity